MNRNKFNKPILAFLIVVFAIGQTWFMTAVREQGMAYAREEATHYKNAISLRDQQIYDLQISAIYWKRTTEKLLSGPTTQVFDCLAVDTSN